MQADFFQDGGFLPMTSRACADLDDLEWRVIRECVPIGVALLKNRRYEMVNPAMSEISGFQEEELLGQSTRIMYAHPEDFERVGKEVLAVFSAGREYAAELLIRRKDRELRWVAVKGRLIDTADAAKGSAWFMQDIHERKTAEEILRESEGKLKLLIEHAPVAIALLDTRMRYLAASRRWVEDYRLGDRNLIGVSHYEVFPEIGEAWRAVHRRALAGEVIHADAERFVRADGAEQWLHWEVRPWLTHAGEVGGLVIFSEDVTRYIQAEDQMRITARVFDQSGEAIMVVGPDNIIQTVNAAFCRITGYAAMDVIGCPTSLLKSGRQSREFYQEMWKSLSSNGFWQGEIWNRRKNGEVYPEWLTINCVDDDQGNVAHYVGVFTDISQIKDSQRKIEFLATHDTLTSLPNRTLFHDRLRHALAQARRRSSRLALLFIDIDNFKTVNDSLGHDIGDALLVEAATRLREAVRDIDTVARLGGDEFTAILTDCTTESANQVAWRIVDGLGGAYLIAEHSLFLSASVGVAFYPEDGQEVAELVRSADAAMYRAKEQGKNRVEFFKQELHTRLLKRTMIESALREAIAHDRLRLVFQPKIGLTAGYPLIGAEALLRWRDPEMGDVSPAEFIPVAEASGLIFDVSRTVQRLLLAQLAEWRRLGKNPPPTAFNVSPRCIREPSCFDDLLNELRTHGLSNRSVQVEITEGALLENSEIVVANLAALAHAAIRVAVDDFGTGYSSLSYLKRLPLSELKIDKSFVDGLGQNREDEAIARAVLALAQALELDTVAEGVETQQQLEWLKQAGCSAAQGYYFARPLEAGAFGKLLAAGGMRAS